MTFLFHELTTQHASFTSTWDFQHPTIYSEVLQNACRLEEELWLLVTWKVDKTISDWDVSYSYRIHTSNILKCIGWKYSQCITRRWFQLFFVVHPYWGKWCNLTCAYFFRTTNQITLQKGFGMKRTLLLNGLGNHDILKIFTMNHNYSYTLWDDRSWITAAPQLYWYLPPLHESVSFWSLWSSGIPWSCRRRSKGHYINCYLICVNLSGAT